MYGQQGGVIGLNSHQSVRTVTSVRGKTVRLIWETRKAVPSLWPVIVSQSTIPPWYAQNNPMANIIGLIDS